MNLLDLEQGGPEWRQARAGSLGASAIHDVVAKTKSGWAASRANRMATLVIEHLTGFPVATFQTAAMAEGVEREPMARSMYEFMTNVTVEQIGMSVHPTIGGTHASPDGLVGADGLLEIKCPQPAQHLATLLGEAIPSKYMLQMYWQMRCCDRLWCDFVSFNPDFPPSMQIFIKRVKRDDDLIRELETEVTAFLNELRETVDRLRAKYEPATRETDEAVLALMAG